MLLSRWTHTNTGNCNAALSRLLSSITGADSAGGQLLSRAFTEPLLSRDFIQQSLYHPEFGYFNRPTPPIRRLPAPINFNRLVGQVEYRLELARAYKQLQVDWLTPVEVFAPWYGRALGHYMLELRKHDPSIDSNTPLAVVEVGGGTGTLAASILDYVSEMDPVAYSSMSYTTIEISSSLAALQQQHILGERGHSSSWRLVAGDASCPSTWQQVASQLPRQHSLSGAHCFVLMMEVLDNLPHDRVVREGHGSPWQQVAVQATTADVGLPVGSDQQQQQPHYSELLQPATDPLIQRCLRALQLSQPDTPDGSNAGSNADGGITSWLQRALGLELPGSDQHNIWLPTRCLQLLEVLHAAAPHHTLIAADFDALPDIQVPGRNAPLVSGRDGSGEVRDYGTVLVPWGAADIFFPTDFDDLGKLYTAAAAAGGGAAGGSSGHQGQGQPSQPPQPPQPSQPPQQERRLRVSHSSTGNFMSAFNEARHTRTLSGYNPLVQDWQNTRLFVGQAA